MRRIKNQDRWQPIDFRYDEGIRGRMEENIAPTLPASAHSNSSCPLIGGGLYMLSKAKDMEEIKELVENGKIKFRRFTPKEYYKLMGFEESDYNKVSYQNESTLYHQGGDSICTTVLCAIFGKLLDIDYEPIINDYVETLKGEHYGN